MLGAPRFSWAPAMGAICVTLVLATARVSPAAVPQPRSVRPAQDSLTATIRRVRADGIEVITGVQYALKVVFIAFDSSTVIRKDGQSITRQTLEPGDLVTVQYRQTERGNVAESVMVQPRPPQGGAR